MGDGAYGNLTYCLIAAEQKLFLISKLTCTTVLFYPPKVGTKQRIYGDRVDFAQLKDHKIDEKRKTTVFLPFFKSKRSEPEILVNSSMSLSFAVTIKKAKNQDLFCYFRPI